MNLVTEPYLVRAHVDTATAARFVLTGFHEDIDADTILETHPFVHRHEGIEATILTSTCSEESSVEEKSWLHRESVADRRTSPRGSEGQKRSAVHPPSAPGHERRRG